MLGNQLQAPATRIQMTTLLLGATKFLKLPVAINQILYWQKTLPKYLKFQPAPSPCDGGGWGRG
jgi:hypothetical protein